MDFIDKQIAPPKSWEKFEDLIRALFAAVWKAPLAQKNGRSGQQQHGVDIYGAPQAEPGKNLGVQCKGKNEGYGAKATIVEFNAELAKAEKFKPMLGHWTFATTAPNDARLQEHVRLVSEQRVKEGKFPVDVLGWESIQALLSGHQAVVEEIYPEYASDLPKIMAVLRALPGVDDFHQMRRSLITIGSRSTAVDVDLSMWSEVLFETSRDLGPALMGRSLGPADVAACPTLPEVTLLIADLELAGSARLAGVPGAGKSISILQVARQMHVRGWRVLRLADPTGTVPPFDNSPIPTLYIVDDAHLTRPALLRELEERSTPSRWVLSAYTISEDKGGFPGAIQLDPKRAVRVIADGLRASPDVTLAAVRRADDRIGDRPGDERLDWRLDQAAKQAQYPWQFCFILGGGWRRARTMASSARAAGADLVLAVAAIRQLASRDAHCSREALLQLIGEALPDADSNAAISWLVAQRFLLSSDDLRCPHQRLSSVLLARIIEGRTAAERPTISVILKTVLADIEMPLSGLSALLNELSLAGNHGELRWLVQRAWLTDVLERCWIASEPLDIRHACWLLGTMRSYLPDEMSVIANHKGILAGWIQAAPEGACYAIGRVISNVLHTNRPLGESIVDLVSPRALAKAISTASALHAGEIADLLTMMGAASNDVWKESYLEHVDRDACHHIVSTWPHDAPLSAVADFCEHFCYFAPEFGFGLVEALIPAIADRLRATPQDSFDELRDIVWHALRLYDPLRIYVGKSAPSRRMRQVGRKICGCWLPEDLASSLSRSTQRNFREAAGLLSFMHKASPKQFQATVLALDWNKIGQTIGPDWVENIGDARMLFAVAYSVTAARLAIQAVVAGNEHRIVSMSTHLAAIAPASALRHVSAGKRIALCNWGQVDWQLGTLGTCKKFCVCGAGFQLIALVKRSPNMMAN